MIQTHVTARRLSVAKVVQVYGIFDTQAPTPTGTVIPPGKEWSTTPPTGPGTIWVSTVNLVNDKVSGSWSKPVRWNGASGQIIRQSEWMSGAHYHNDGEDVEAPRYRDVVLVYASNGAISRYMCDQTHTANDMNKPSALKKNEWTLLSGDFPLYTPLLVAENGDIRFLQSNRMLIYDNDQTVVGGMSGNGTYWMGGPSPDEAKNVDRADGSGHRAGKNIFWDPSGNVSITGEANIISGTIGNIKIEENDLVGLNDSDEERVRISLSEIPPITDIFSSKYLNFTMESKKGVVITGTNPAQRNGAIYSTYNMPYENPLYRSFDVSITFDVPEPTTLAMRARSSLDVMNQTLPSDLRGHASLWKNGKHLKDVGSLNEKFDNVETTISDAGTYQIVFELIVYGDMDTWRGNIRLEVDGIYYRHSPNKTLIGSNGYASIFGALNYVYFSQNHGFEVRVGPSGLRVQEKKLQKCKDGAWIDL